MAQIGYDHKDSGETLYFKFPFKKYHLLIHKLTGQKDINKPLMFKLDHTKSSYGLKYGAKFQNIFYYRINPENSDKTLQLLNFNLIVSQKTKLIKLVNFDVSPIVKLSMHNVSSQFPFNLSFKFGKYQGSRIQHFDNTEQDNYDLSKVVKSLLPFYRSCLNLSHSRDFTLNFNNKPVEILTKCSCSLNRIHSYEDNIKLSTNVKIYYDIYEEFKKLFRLRICNEFSIKKSFIISNKKNKKKDFYEDSNYGNVSKVYKENHILSGYECHSKLLEMNLLNLDNVIDNGSNFYLQNVLTLRLKDIPSLKDKEILSRINPYFSLETIFLPIYTKGVKDKSSEIDFKNSFRYIYTLGVSLSLNDYMHINFGLYTGASNNTKIKKDLVKRFRITLSL